MIYLILVSLIWSLSFGLIKGNLAGLDSHFVSFSRLAISFIFFVPFLRLGPFNKKQIATLISIGAVQFGLMYIFYIHAFQFLEAWQIALFTIFTPIYVTVIYDFLNGRFKIKFFAASLLSVVGAALIVLNDMGKLELQIGFVLIQLSNLCFAIGQVYFKKFSKNLPQVSAIKMMSWLYIGAVITAFVNAIIMSDWNLEIVNQTHIYTLLYLGIIASGVGFFLFNLGATKVNSGTLAVMNNIKVPLGIFASLFLFGEEGNVQKLMLGGFIILIALYLSEFWKYEESGKKV